MTFDPVKFVASPFRHIAAWSNFNDVQQHLLKRFDRRRLVVRKGEADGGNVEVAHEALFRTWKRLGSWLEPERARLEALRSLRVDAGNWKRNAKNPCFLNHRSSRLAEGPRYAGLLIENDFDYLAACRAAEQKALTRTRRVKVRVTRLVALLGLSGAGLVYREAIAQEVTGQYRWRMATGPTCSRSSRRRQWRESRARTSRNVRTAAR